MKINNIKYSTYNKNINNNHSDKFNFKRKPNFDNLTNILTKKNIAYATILTMIITEILKQFDVDIPEVFNQLDRFLIGLLLCINEKPQKLNKKIAFYKANTIEEAKKFAKEKLKIKNFAVNDLEYANWINEGLTNISNKFEGNVYFPQKIKLSEKKSSDAYGSYHLINDTVTIYKKEIEKTANELESILKNNKFEELTKYKLDNNYNNFYEKLKKAYNNPSSLSIFEKFSLVRSSKSVKNFLKNQQNKNTISLNNNSIISNNGNIYIDEFNTIYHEIGHCFDTKSNILITMMFERFLYQKKLKKLSLPKNHIRNTQEFVANIFAGLIQNKKYPLEITNLYKRLIKFKPLKLHD